MPKIISVVTHTKGHTTLSAEMGACVLCRDRTQLNGSGMLVGLGQLSTEDKGYRYHMSFDQSKSSSSSIRSLAAEFILRCSGHVVGGPIVPGSCGGLVYG